MAISTQPQAPAELARHAVGLINAHDLDGLSAVWHEEIVEDFVAVGTYSGRDELRAFFAELFAAFPDYEMTVDLVLADERQAFMQWHGSGSFSGAQFQGIDPNGKRIDVRGVDLMEFENSLLRRNTVYYDGATFSRQLGMLPARGSGAERAMVTAFNATTAVRNRLSR
jgi:steroid delta-isomerase-like uncharacterized protein